MQTEFKRALARDAAQIEAYLAQWLAQLSTRVPHAPQRLIDAVRHGVLGGGKRLRPFLVLEVARIFNKAHEALPAAAAIELIHCYSLVHDDLPCMDNDTLRRGLPTVHVEFDEATALLAGNVMLTHAFEVLCHPERSEGSPADYAQTYGDSSLALRMTTQLLQTLITGAGLNGMLGGQQWDLAAEGRFAETPAADMNTEAAITQLQSMKTGALILAAVKMGAIIGGATLAQMQLLELYAYHLGLAFQISDDILDTIGSAQSAGKATQKDAGAGKATFVLLLGLEGARLKLSQVIAEGQGALQQLGMPCLALHGALLAMDGRGA